MVDIYQTPKSTVSPQDRIIDARNQKRVWLFFTLLIFALIGFFRSAWFDDYSGIQKAAVGLTSFAYLLALIWWVKIDAPTNRFLLSPVFSLLLFIFSPFVFPYYCVKTRGARAGVLQAIKGVLYLVLVTVSLVAVQVFTSLAIAVL